MRCELTDYCVCMAALDSAVVFPVIRYCCKAQDRGFNINQNANKLL